MPLARFLVMYYSPFLAQKTFVIISAPNRRIMALSNSRVRFPNREPVSIEECSFKSLVFVRSGFMLFWGLIFILATTLIFIFKKDNSLDCIVENDLKCRLGLTKCYLRLWQIVKIKAVKKISLLLMTCMVNVFHTIGSAIPFWTGINGMFLVPDILRTNKWRG